MADLRTCITAKQFPTMGSWQEVVRRVSGSGWPLVANGDPLVAPRLLGPDSHPTLLGPSATTRLPTVLFPDQCTGTKTP